jgi:hypothetical protein
LPIEHKTEKDVCDGCGKHAEEVGIVRFRKEHGINKHLCSKCCHRSLGEYDKICCKCNKNNADGSFEMRSYNGEDMCDDCIEKEELKRIQREERKAKRTTQKLTTKNFLLNNWKVWFGAAVAIILAIYFSS